MWSDFTDTNSTKGSGSGHVLIVTHKQITTKLTFPDYWKVFVSSRRGSTERHRRRSLTIVDVKRTNFFFLGQSQVVRRHVSSLPPSDRVSFWAQCPYHRSDLLVLVAGSLERSDGALRTGESARPPSGGFSPDVFVSPFVGSSWTPAGQVG